jgi:hypothetical protein
MRAPLDDGADLNIFWHRQSRLLVRSSWKLFEICVFALRRGQSPPRNADIYLTVPLQVLLIIALIKQQLNPRS